MSYGVGWWLQLLFNLYPGNLHMPRVRLKKKKKIHQGSAEKWPHETYFLCLDLKASSPGGWGEPCRGWNSSSCGVQASAGTSWEGQGPGAGLLCRVRTGATAAPGPRNHPRERGCTWQMSALPGDRDLENVMKSWPLLPIRSYTRSHGKGVTECPALQSHPGTQATV